MPPPLIKPLSFLDMLFLFIKRDTRHLSSSAHVLLVPLFIFALALFLFSFLSIQYESIFSKGHTFSLFILFLFMSLSSASKHLILQDKANGFLDDITSNTTSLAPYLISKILSHSLPWLLSSLLLWGVFDGINMVNTLIFTSLIFPLTSLFLTVETLSLKSTQSAGIGLILIAPLILPLFIIALWTLEYSKKNQGLIALVLCSFILTTLSLWLAKKLIKQA